MRRCYYLRRSAGFTLIEMVLVVTIIGILATALVIQATQKTRDARRARALLDMSALEGATDTYIADNDAAPPNLAALSREPSPAPINWNGPYLKKRVDKDPWGYDYVYIVPGRYNKDSYDLICYGADGKPGGAGYDADITNYDEE